MNYKLHIRCQYCGGKNIITVNVGQPKSDFYSSGTVGITPEYLTSSVGGNVQGTPIQNKDGKPHSIYDDVGDTPEVQEGLKRQFGSKTQQIEDASNRDLERGGHDSIEVEDEE